MSRPGCQDQDEIDNWMTGVISTHDMSTGGFQNKKRCRALMSHN